jgi:putative oxidoreductase
MTNPISPPRSAWQEQGLAFLRILTGLLMAYHGLEVFEPDKIAEYAGWEQLKALPAPLLAAYLGKGLELLSGLMLALGLLTRLACGLMALDMLLVCFWVGGGKFYYQDQHPFLFAVLAAVFFLTGPVKWSLDQRLFPAHPKSVKP